jgi:hypothetical protein
MTQQGPPRRTAGLRPDLATAASVEVLVAATRRGVWRAAVPMLVVAVFFGVVWLPFRDDGDLGLPLISLCFLIAGALRVALWQRTLAARSLVSTDVNLLVVSRNRVVRWVSWAEVTGIEVYGGDLLPEWKRVGAAWFTITVLPRTRVRPESAFVGELVQMLVRRRDRDSAHLSILTVARQHGVPVTYLA